MGVHSIKGHQLGDIIPFPRLNQTNDFECELRGAYMEIGEHSESRENRLDHLKMGNGISAKHLVLTTLSSVIFP
jgi:hypothetical protein